MNREADWFEQNEGQLSVDVLETPEGIMVFSAIAGISAADLDIAVTSDTVTIRGTRKPVCKAGNDDVLHVEECFWGAFSRSVVLPCHVQPEATGASLKNGVLTVTLKKVEMKTTVPVIEKADE